MVGGKIEFVDIALKSYGENHPLGADDSAVALYQMKAAVFRTHLHHFCSASNIDTERIGVCGPVLENGLTRCCLEGKVRAQR